MLARRLLRKGFDVTCAEVGLQALAATMYRATERGRIYSTVQPILSLKTNQIEGVEALIRWCDSDGNPVSPNIFIALAEETNLVVDIGKWILGETCQQMAKWNATATGGR